MSIGECLLLVGPGLQMVEQDPCLVCVELAELSLEQLHLTVLYVELGLWIDESVVWVSPSPELVLFDHQVHDQVVLLQCDSLLHE